MVKRQKRQRQRQRQKPRQSRLYPCSSKTEGCPLKSHCSVRNTITPETTSNEHSLLLFYTSSQLKYQNPRLFRVFKKKLWLAKTCTRDPQFRPGGFKVLKSLPKFLFHQKRNLWIYKNCKGAEPSNHAMWLQNFEFLLLPKLNFIRKEIELLKSAGPRY